MIIVIEFDGVIADQQQAWYAAHVAVSRAVGWSTLDSGAFWRLIRTKGRQADLLPAAKEAKLAEYWAKFDQLVESVDSIEQFTLDDEMRASAAALARHGDLRLATLGSNLPARRQWLEKHNLLRFFKQFEKLDADPRRRPAELKLLTKPDPRSIAVCASDTLVRSASAADIVTVGISSGPCTAARLHQAGAGVVYKELSELTESLEAGARNLIQAGLLPRSLDAPTA